jgi:hypothetical protein
MQVRRLRCHTLWPPRSISSRAGAGSSPARAPGPADRCPAVDGRHVLDGATRAHMARIRPWRPTPSTSKQSHGHASSSTPASTCSRASETTSSRAPPKRTPTWSPTPGGVRPVAPSPHRRRRRRDQGPLRFRLRRLPPPASHGLDRLPVPGRRMAPQGGRARRPQPAPVPRQAQRLTVCGGARPKSREVGMPRTWRVELGWGLLDRYPPLRSVSLSGALLTPHSFIPDGRDRPRKCWSAWR